MKKESVIISRRLRNTLRHTWEGVFGKTNKTKAIEASWERQIGNLFTADRITMTTKDRARHYSGPEWLEHLKRQREKKSAKRTLKRK